jgi:hypothetical protein
MIRFHSSPRRLVGFYLLFLAAIVSQPWKLLAQAPTPAAGVKFATVSESDMKTFLAYLASDELLGRDAYSEGYGLAAAYVADHLRQWGLKPLGDNGTYFQAVKNRGYRVTRNSAVTVTANGQTRTFKHGDHVTFPINSGGRQSLKFDGVEFVGYGLVMLPSPTTNNIGHDDFRGRNVKGQLVAWLPGAPSALAQGGGRGGRGGGGGNRANYAIQTAGAGAVLSFSPSLPPPSAAEEALAKAQDALGQATQAVIDAQAQLRAAARGGRGGGRAGGARGGRGAAPVAADLTTVLKVDNVVPPQITADEVFYEFLFGAETFAKLRAAAESGAPLTPTRVPAQISIDIDNSYEVVSTQISKNVIGMVEGSDPKLRDTYVLFGSHLDHTGYRTSVQTGGRGGRGAATPGGGEPDLINNGADDDGSGSTALMGIAKAFATGPRPRRSVVFVWHTGEEDGLLGSRYMADFPVVPLDRVQAQFNIDMIGRNRDDDPALGNTVFVIGADRISTDLHNLVVDTNQSTAKPLTLDYEYNDPADPNSFYTRSDHYSYAAKGIPIAFFFTGTHIDYHQPTDHADKILYPKLTRIAQLVYQAGFNVAHSERTLTRDNRGPRSGRGFSGRIDK